jgi:hypothetical protein
MVKLNGSVNCGFCQGVVKGDVYSPADSVAKVNIQVKDERKNPKTKKRPLYVLNFTAFDENAHQLVKHCKAGDILFVRYHLDVKVNIDRHTGIGAFRDERIIDDVVLCKPSGKRTVANLNCGIFQGVFIGITKQPNADNIYMVSVLEERSSDNSKLHQRFVVYGALGEFIESNFTKGELVLVEYKIEKSKRLRPDGQADYFTNCVLEKIG